LINKTIFCLGITDFGSDTPVGKDHLMMQYAKDNQVVMFNLSGNRAPTIKRGYDRKRLVRKVWNWFLFPKIINNIIVVYPVRFPFIGSKFFDILNNGILYLYLAYYKSKYYSKSPIIFSLSPFYFGAIKRIKPKKIIYYVSDAYGMFSGIKEITFNEYERKFISQCDGVITVSELLFNKMQRYNKNVIKIFNASNPNMFAGKNFKKPDDMIKFKGAIVGCIGKFDDWYDLEFVDKLAKLNKNKNFVFVGPVMRPIDNIKSKNIFYLGQKKYTEIPNYIHSFDVCIIPYKNIERIKTVDMPLKLLDFLSSGKPVIAKNINFIAEYNHLYKICNTIEDFNVKLNSYLTRSDSYKKARIQFALQNSWEKRAEEISNWLET
jgi:glycosyltransferase involved in cell wall biosynthesis